MRIRKGNPYAAVMVIIFTAVIFLGYWVMMPGYAKIYDIFNDDSSLAKYTTEASCKDRGNYWVNGACSQLSERASDVIEQQRLAWLVAPFIFVFGLILWLITKSTNNDYQQYNGPLQ